MKLSHVLAGLAVGVMLATPASAEMMVDPVLVWSPAGDFSSEFALRNIINQSGLSAHYVSGVTDFASFTATTTHYSADGLNSGLTDSISLPQTIKLTLSGDPDLIDEVAFWGTAHPGSVTEFELLNGGVIIGGPFFTTPGTGVNDPAQTFSFAPVLATSVDLLVLNTAAATDHILSVAAIGEIAFGALATSVPEPAPLAILGSGLLGLCLLRRRVRGPAS